MLVYLYNGKLHSQENNWITIAGINMEELKKNTHNDDQKKKVVWFHLYMISFIERTKIGKAKYYTLRDAYT